MSHGDSVSPAPPEGFERAGDARRAPRSPRSSTDGPPPVRRAVAPRGQALGVRPAGARELPLNGAGLEPDWTTGNIIDEQVERIRAQVGDGRVICGLSGGVDSAVAAALVQRAVGDQLTCVFVDHGLLREGEAEQVERDFVAATGVKLKVVDAAERFLGALAGVTDPETSARSSAASSSAPSRRPRATWSPRPRRDGETIEFLVQGTLYPDVVESGGGRARRTSRATTTSAACPTTCSSSSSSRCAPCSRTRCARSGSSWGCPRRSSAASRSRAPGSAIRIVGEVTAERLETAARGGRDRPRRADRGRPGRRHLAVPRRAAGGRAVVGVQGDGRTYGHPIVLRPVSSARTP